MLPKIDTPVFNLKLPLTGKEIKYRPFLVKEEKILLTAKESSNFQQNIDAIIQVVNNCLMIDDDPLDWPMLDVEYAFLNMRAQSVNNIVEVRYRDNQDKKVRDFEVDINQVEIVRPEGHTNKFKITDDITIKLKYPSVRSLRSLEKLDMNDPSSVFQVISKTLDTVQDKDTVYDSFTEEEAGEFLEQFTQSQMEMVNDFMSTMPYYEHVIDYVNDEGNDRKISMRGIQDFFS